jgi:SET domain-containing protein
MALLVKTRIGPSKIAGTGLFAAEFIPQGTKVWEFTPGFDLVFEDLNRFPPLVRAFLTTYCYRNGGRYVFCADHAKFFNHSDEPSCRDDAHNTYAARDIHPGEELTSDYRMFGVTQEDLEFNYRDFTQPSHHSYRVLIP